MIDHMLLGAAPITATGTIVGTAAAAARIGERWRDPRRPCAVVDARTYRAAVRQVDRLLTSGDDRDVVHAQVCLTAMRIWLRDEVRTGPRRHRVRRARELEHVELRSEQLDVPII